MTMFLLKELKKRKHHLEALFFQVLPKEKPSQGEVVAVGPGKVSESGDSTPVNVSVGDTVIFGQYGGNEIKLDGDEYLILSERDIFGVVE
jgi:chaperonin GroES